MEGREEEQTTRLRTQAEVTRRTETRVRKEDVGQERTGGSEARTGRFEQHFRLRGDPEAGREGLAGPREWAQAEGSLGVPTEQRWQLAGLEKRLEAGEERLARTQDQLQAEEERSEEDRTQLAAVVAREAAQEAQAEDKLVILEGRLSREYDLVEVAREQAARLQRRLQRAEQHQEAARDQNRRQEEERWRNEEFAVTAARELAVDISRDLQAEERQEITLATQLQEQERHIAWQASVIEAARNSSDNLVRLLRTEEGRSVDLLCTIQKEEDCIAGLSARCALEERRAGFLERTVSQSTKLVQEKAETAASRPSVAEAIAEGHTRGRVAEAQVLVGHLRCAGGGGDYAQVARAQPQL